MTIGKRLRKIRVEQGLTTIELGMRANISQAMISRIENDRANPTIDKVVSIARALNVPIFKLLDEDDCYNADVFTRVLHLIETYPNRFDEINRFMGHEYGIKWIFFITSKGYDCLCGMPNKNSFRVPL